MSLLEEYEAFVADALAPGFGYRELVNGTQNQMLPPKSKWHRIIPCLHFGNDLRRVMMTKHGAKGLLLHAAYRPKGGAASSLHKDNGAADFDLFPSDYDLAPQFATELVTLFCEWSVNWSCGLGLYGRHGSCATIRGHIDFGKYKSGQDRGWQIYAGREVGLAKSDIARIAKRDGLTLP